MIKNLSKDYWGGASSSLSAPSDLSIARGIVSGWWTIRAMVSRESDRILGRPHRHGLSSPDFTHEDRSVSDPVGLPRCMRYYTLLDDLCVETQGSYNLRNKENEVPTTPSWLSP